MFTEISDSRSSKCECSVVLDRWDNVVRLHKHKNCQFSLQLFLQTWVSKLFLDDCSYLWYSNIVCDIVGLFCDFIVDLFFLLFRKLIFDNQKIIMVRKFVFWNV